VGPEYEGPGRAFVVLNVTPTGGTRAARYHVPLVAFSHLLAFVVLAAWMTLALARGRWLPKTPLDERILASYPLSPFYATAPTRQTDQGPSR